jgi:hypothetical protein
MSIGVGFNHFLSWKPQTAHGVKASGLTKTMVPIRTGRMFDPNSYRTLRQTVVQPIGKVANLFTVAKTVAWAAELELINPRLANDTITDFLKTFFGKMVTTAGPPTTKTFTINDPLIDGGTDGTPANNTYGRGLTLHEQCDRSDGVAIFAHEVQDAVVDTLAIVWEPDSVARLRISGSASDLQDDMTDITPADPTGAVHTWGEMRNSSTSGLRIGTANPPVQADNVVHSRATLTFRQPIRYVPFLGEAATQQVRIPVRSDMITCELEVQCDVEDAVASQYDAKDIIDHWVAGTGVNIDILSRIASDQIFEFKATGTTAAAIVDRFGNETPNAGPMQHTATFRILPNALADLSVVITAID